MSEMDMRIETRETTRQKAAALFGLDQPSPFDVVPREKYGSDAEYIDAVVMEQMKQSSPEYQAARRKMAVEYAARAEKQQRDAQAAAYKEIRSAVQLDSVDQRGIDAEAVELARRDLSAGRIAASGLGAAIEKHAKELSEKRKDTKASNQLFNDMLRGNR